MKISNVSFKGRYIETYNPSGENQNLIKELRLARPYLRQIAYSMPEDMDLAVNISKDDKNREYIAARSYDRTNETKDLLAKSYGAYYSVGLDYTGKVLNGIKNFYPDIYPKVLDNFVQNFNRIDSEIEISKSLTSDKVDIFNKIYP